MKPIRHIINLPFTKAQPAWTTYNMLRFTSLLVAGIWMARSGTPISIIEKYELLILLGGSFSFFYVSAIHQNLFPWHAKQLKTPNTLFYGVNNFLILGSLGSVMAVSIYLWLVPNALYLIEILLFLIFLSINISCFGFEAYLQLKEKWKTLFIYGIFQFIFYPIVVMAPLLMGYSLAHSLTGLVVYACIKWLWAYKQMGFKFKTSIIKENAVFLKNSLPLMGSFILGGSIMYISPLIIQANGSNLDFVLFRYGAREFPLFMIGANALSNVWSGKIANEENGFLGAWKRYIYWTLPVAVVLLITAPYLFLWVYGTPYAEAASVFMILVLLLFARWLFPQTFLLHLVKNKHLLRASAVELIVGIVAAFIGMHYLGIKGVAWALVVAFITEKIYLIFACYTEGIPFIKKAPIRAILVAFLLLGISYFVGINLKSHAF